MRERTEVIELAFDELIVERCSADELKKTNDLRLRASCKNNQRHTRQGDGDLPKLHH